jgi:hypothetical protein
MTISVIVYSEHLHDLGLWVWQTVERNYCHFYIPHANPMAETKIDQCIYSSRTHSVDLSWQSDEAIKYVCAAIK